MAEVIADLVGALRFDADDKGVKQFARGVDDLAKASDTATARGTALGTLMGNLATKAVDLAVAVGKAAYAAGKDLVVGFAEGGVEIDRMAKRADLSTTALQRWGAAARKAGIEPEGATKAVEVLNKNLSELTMKGSGPAKDALGLLGVEMSELAGLDTEGQLMLVADALAAMPDAADRASLTMQLFGEEAAKLSPILAQGSAGLDALGDAAEQAGLVLDEKAVESAKRTKAALGAIDKTTTALGNTIAVALAPTVADLAERFGAWYRENEELIAQRVPEVVDQIVEGVTELVHWGQELAGGIENLMGLFRDFGQEGENTGGALIGVLSTMVEWSKAGIEAFVEWTDDVAALADVVWDVGGAIKDGLVTAYEAAEEVIDRVSGVIQEQLGFLDPVVEMIEGIVERLSDARAIVTDIAEEVGLTRAFSAEDRAAIDQAIERETAPARTMIDDARSERDYQQRVDEYQERLIGEAKEAEAAKARRRRGAKYGAKLRAGSGGGSKAVDTEAAERLFGSEIDDLARASGASPKARKAAIEAAAKALEGGASEGPARQAALSSLSSSTGLDLGATGGADAALFGALTQIGGPQAARSAADGARFVQVSNVFNSTFNYELRLPDGFGDGLRTDVDALAGSTARQIVEQWEQVIDRFGQGLEP